MPKPPDVGSAPPAGESSEGTSRNVSAEGKANTAAFINAKLPEALRSLEAERADDPVNDRKEFAFRLTRIMLGIADKPPYAGKIDAIALASLLENELFARSSVPSAAVQRRDRA